MNELSFRIMNWSIVEFEMFTNDVLFDPNIVNDELFMFTFEEL